MVLTVPEAEFSWSFSPRVLYISEMYFTDIPNYTDEQHKKKAKREIIIMIIKIDQKVSKQRATEIYFYMYYNFESYRQLLRKKYSGN